MKTITVNLYEFNELSEAAKETALNELRDINVGRNWWDLTYDEANILGFNITGFYLERNIKVELETVLNPLEIAQNILNEHGENCNTFIIATNFLTLHSPIYADYLDENSKGYESQENELQLMEIEDNFLNELAKEYHKILVNEFDYLASDEAIIETIEANEYYFTECGTLTNN